MEMEEEKSRQIESKKKSVPTVVFGASLICCVACLISLFGAGACGSPVMMTSMPLHEYRDVGSGVVINEFMAIPLAGSDWVELYNPTAENISLDLWTITDGAANAIDLTGKTIGAHGYLVLEFSNKLNNAGDIIYLNDPTATVDSVTYGSWDDGNFADNAPAPEAGQSAGRYPDGSDTNNDSADFRIFTTPTPGALNTVHEEPQSATVHIDDAHANPGESTVSLITIHNATNLGSIDLELTYNHSVVLVTNASAGGFDETVINLEENAAGFVKVVAFQSENSGLNGTVVLAELELTAVGGAHACSPLNLSVKKMTDATPECADLPCAVRNGTFSTNFPPVADAGPDQTVLLNDTVWFNASHSYDPDGALIAFCWDFGDGCNATGVSVTHRYTQNGLFVVNLTVTDTDGATSSDTCTITVNAPPVADAGPDQVCLVGDTVYFNGSGSYDPDGLICTYQWNFGDGANATGATVTHCYADAGTYTVTLTVLDNLGSIDVATCAVTVFLNGDVNGNGECEISDAMYLARHLAEIAGFESIEEIVCDMNGNGRVEISDALYLARHLAHISGFEELK